MDSIPTDLLEL